MAYVGEYQDRLRDGHGAYVFPGGSFQYDGEWKRGKMHGRGIFSLPDGGTYEGEFVSGEIDGIGLRRWPDGSTYNGQFRRGERHGEGVFIGTNGGVYEGHWDHNQRHGLGELRTANRDIYRGDFYRHKPHGNGKIIFANDKSTYDGDWVDGQICGRGVLKDAQSRQLYQGEWHNGQRCGHGVGFLSPSTTCSTLFDGVWAHDQPLAATTTLALKIAVLPSAEDAGTKDGTPVPVEVQDAPAVITLDKKVDLRLPPLAGVSLHASTTDSAPSIVKGESGRALRLRVFEGSIPLVSAHAGADSSEEIAPPSQWQFTKATEATPSVSASEESSNQEPPTTLDSGAEPPAPEEPRIEVVVASNEAGIAVFEELALPTASLVGTYHLVCDCLDSGDDLAPAYVTLHIVE